VTRGHVLALSLALAPPASTLPAGRPDRIEHRFYADGALESVRAFRAGRQVGVERRYWPNGRARSVAAFRDDAYHGLRLAWDEAGALRERRHYEQGRESGPQQAWTETGELYLNYEVRDGRRYGFVNAHPCVPVLAPGATEGTPPANGVQPPTSGERAGTSRARLPYYDSPELTPRWRPVSHRVASFDLRAQTGARVTDAELRGRIHVASFVFTSCPSLCPTLVGRLRRVQAAAANWPDVRLVSFSVAPAADTPEVLAEFGRQRGIDPGRWLLLTGDAAQIRRLARESYFADDSRGGAQALLHTEKLLLVDAESRLRGVYNGSQPFDVERLIADIAALRGAAASP
jgi:protein SCO1/2